MKSKRCGYPTGIYRFENEGRQKLVKKEVYTRAPLRYDILGGLGLKIVWRSAKIKAYIDINLI